jgi:aspartate/methionine/tyrosine aminotransferase
MLGLEQGDDGFVDLRVGEPTLVYRALRDAVGVTEIERILRRAGSRAESSLSRYPTVPGDTGLIQEIREKHRTDAPIVVTYGATQGIVASLVAARKLFPEQSSLAFRAPYWPYTPKFAEAAGYVPFVTNEIVQMPSLVASPNNPDGWTIGRPEYNRYMEVRELGCPVIHDAVYRSELFDRSLRYSKPFGNVEVHSLSKTLGVPGLRVGYVICDDPGFYRPILEYVETTSGGVPLILQYTALETLGHLRRYSDVRLDFQSLAMAQLATNRAMFDMVPESIIGSNEATDRSMFGWYPKGPLLDLAKSRVSLLDGATCGSPEMVRANLAAPEADVWEAAYRLSQLDPR